MAKRKKNDLGVIATAVAALLGVVAVIMLFLPAIAVKNSEITYTGLQSVFGYSETAKGFGNTTVTTEYMKFSFMNLLTYILVIVGVVFTVLSYLGKGCKFATLIATVAFLVAGVFFLLTVSFSMPTDTVGLQAGISNWEDLLKGNDFNVKDYLTLGVGSIIGAICSFLAAAASGYRIIKK